MSKPNLMEISDHDIDKMYIQWLEDELYRKEALLATTQQTLRHLLINGLPQGKN